MSVRHSLLAILDQGPCYGYQLRSEFDRRTGSIWPLNVGQIYNTLDRLERDGLVGKDDIDAQGHVYWHITPQGRSALQSWLDSPITRPDSARDELTMKLAMAATLPGADVQGILRAQRTSSAARVAQLRSASYPGDPSDPEAVAWAIVSDARLLAAEAEARWLEGVEERLAQHPPTSVQLALSNDRPRRGRPAAGAS